MCYTSIDVDFMVCANGTIGPSTVGKTRMKSLKFFDKIFFQFFFAPNGPDIVLPPTSSDTATKSGLSGGAVIGIATGGVGVVALGVAAFTGKLGVISSAIGVTHFGMRPSKQMWKTLKL